jgi:hypothetical protein
MGKYWRLIGQYDAETQTYSGCAGAAQTSPYTPDEDATLVGIRTVVGQLAATTLTTNGQIRLTCTTFKPNTIHVGYIGRGIATAPAIAPAPLDFEVRQPVKAGVPITVEGRCMGASDVTNSIEIYGMFES